VAMLTVLGAKGLEANPQFLAAAASCFARELHCALTTSVPSLQSLAGNLFEYSAEPSDSFEKHIYPLYDGATSKDGVVRLGKRAALAILEDGEAGSAASADAIRSQYRKLSRKYHPDRLAGAAAPTAAEEEAAKKQFQDVQDAYSLLGAETHSIGYSWYESIGSNERDGFSGALELGAVGVAAPGAEMGHEGGGWSQAIQALNAPVPLFFATRNAVAAAAN
jgi:hypothetical protein